MDLIPSGRSDGAPPERPVVQVRVADATDLHLTWRWLGGAAGHGIGRAPAESVVGLLRKGISALPMSGSHERLRAAFDGPYARPDDEGRFSRELGRELWPDSLTDQIRQVGAALGRPLLRLQPSASTAAVPWELLAVDDDGTRLVELADVATAAPIGLRSGRGPGAPPGPAVHVIDPVVPGVGRGSGLGPVLADPATDPHLTLLAERAVATGGAPTVDRPSDLFRRTDLDRAWLSDRLRSGADRLFYVGHVTAAPIEGGRAEDTRLHLCCRSDAPGLAPPIRGHRPLSAKDLLLGELPTRPDGLPGSEIWPAPSRVALIGCDSGGDARFVESFGLASAMLFGGADIVTAARWTLPTDHAFHRVGGLDPATRPLSALVLAVDSAHLADDPIGALGDWQRGRLAAWRDGGALEDAPLLWAAMTSIVV